jgi:hypothetical protein
MKGIGGIGSALSSMSDVRAKEDIKPAKASSIMEQLDAYDYDYKPAPAAYQALMEAKRMREKGMDVSLGDVFRMYEEFNDEPRTGVMAQDMEKAGSDAVVTKEVGKALDVHKSLGLSLAATADLAKRVRSLEDVIKGGTNGRA